MTYKPTSGPVSNPTGTGANETPSVRNSQVGISGPQTIYRGGAAGMPRRRSDALPPVSNHVAGSDAL